MSDNQTTQTFDTVVIGGGAAGLSGALCLARARRSVLVVDDATPRNAPAGHVHNYLTRDGTPPAELVALGRAEVESYGATVRTATVTHVTRIDDPPREHGDPGLPPRFVVQLSDGATVRARRLLVTTGLVDELPAVDGLREHWGDTVLHCPFCHGWEVRDRPVVIIASSPMAAHQALLWSNWTARVTVVGPVAADRVDELEARGVTLVPTAATALEVVDGRLDGVRLEDGTVVPCEAVVVATRLVARSALLAQLGVETRDMVVQGAVIGTHVSAAPDGSTGVDGVWVAGNVTDPMAQVIAAAAAGLKAGAAITGDLVMEEARIAVAARRTSADVEA